MVLRKFNTLVSSYYLADEISATYRGMMIGIPSREWEVFEQMSLIELTKVLRDLAALVNLAAFVRHPLKSYPKIRPQSEHLERAAPRSHEIL